MLTDRQTDGQTDGHHQSINRNCFAILPMMKCNQSGKTVQFYYTSALVNSIPSSGVREGNSYICSTVLRLRGMQNPNSKSKLFNNLSLKKCLSIIRNLFTALSPTTNSTLKIWQKTSLCQEYLGAAVRLFLTFCLESMTEILTDAVKRIYKVDNKQTNRMKRIFSLLFNLGHNKYVRTSCYKE